MNIVAAGESIFFIRVKKFIIFIYYVRLTELNFFEVVTKV